MIEFILTVVLIVLSMIWAVCHEEAHTRISFKTKDDYKKIKSYVKSTKKYKWFAIPANIIIIITSIYLITILSEYSNYLENLNKNLAIKHGAKLAVFVVQILTMGNYRYEFTDSQFNEVNEVFVWPQYTMYIPYILLYAIIIKNIFFNVQLYKLLNSKNKKFCRNCGTEVNGDFCENCGDKII